VGTINRTRLATLRGCRDVNCHDDVVGISRPVFLERRDSSEQIVGHMDARLLVTRVRIETASEGREARRRRGTVALFSIVLIP